jgi:hypothetical protein
MKLSQTNRDGKHAPYCAMIQPKIGTVVFSRIDPNGYVEDGRRRRRGQW